MRRGSPPPGDTSEAWPERCDALIAVARRRRRSLSLVVANSGRLTDAGPESTGMSRLRAKSLCSSLSCPRGRLAVSPTRHGIESLLAVVGECTRRRESMVSRETSAGSLCGSGCAKGGCGAVTRCRRRAIIQVVDRTCSMDGCAAQVRGPRRGSPAFHVKHRTRMGRSDRDWCVLAFPRAKSLMRSVPVPSGPARPGRAGTRLVG
jgi:hypothetical protein